jgi:hypothetical protein
VGIVIAFRMYVEGRHWLINWELLIPLLLGGLPGLLVYWLASRLIRSRP